MYCALSLLELRLRFSVNGVCVFRSDGSSANEAMETINPWLNAGVNRLKCILITSTTGGHSVDSAGITRTIFVSLAVEFPRPAKPPIVAYHWPSSREPFVVPGGGDVLHEENIHITHRLGPWSFQMARKFLDLPVAAKEGILAAYFRIRAASAKQDVQETMLLTSIRMQELCAAYGLDQQDFREISETDWRKLSRLKLVPYLRKSMRFVSI